MNKRLEMACTALAVLYSPALLYAADLAGNWQCQGQSGPATIEFKTNSLLSFNGEEAQYALVAGAIVVQGEDGIMAYPYTLKGKNLTVTFPDGFLMRCARAQGGEAGKKSAGAVPRQPGGEANHLLRGSLCSWSGSRSGSSSYSSSGRVSFDGRGRFVYGSESSFSSSAGMAYGASPGSGGSYRVIGDKVHITFGDGSTGVAAVNFRQNDGRITELMYDGKLYGMALCE
jgi:hypothetical protein